MASNLTSRRYQIISLTKGNPPVGVDGRLYSAVQLVRLNAPDTIWAIRDGDKPSSYRFSVGPYSSTTVISNKVAGTIHTETDVEWIAVYQEHYDAYTIEPARRPPGSAGGWTVTDDSPDSTISIKPIVINPSIPPRYRLSQLFQFIPEDDDEDE